jgi:hypothetical protein
MFGSCQSLRPVVLFPRTNFACDYAPRLRGDKFKRGVDEMKKINLISLGKIISPALK